MNQIRRSGKQNERHSAIPCSLAHLQHFHFPSLAERRTCPEKYCRVYIICFLKLRLSTKYQKISSIITSKTYIFMLFTIFLLGNKTFFTFAHCSPFTILHYFFRVFSFFTMRQRQAMPVFFYNRMMSCRVNHIDGIFFAYTLVAFCIVLAILPASSFPSRYTAFDFVIPFRKCILACRNMLIYADALIFPIIRSFTFFTVQFKNTFGLLKLVLLEVNVKCWQYKFENAG